MNVKSEKLPKSAIKLTVTVPQEKVTEAFNKVIEHEITHVSVKGFRQGQAPKEMAKQKLDPSKLYGEIINVLLEKYYPEAVKEEKINPIASPKVEIKEFDTKKDFVFEATVAIRPEIKVGDYQKALEKARKEKGQKIDKSEKEEDKNQPKILNSTEVIDVVADSTKVEVADLLIEEETDRMLHRLEHQAQSIGITVEQFLKSQNKTEEDLKKEYSAIAERNLKSEFALSELIELEKIEVTDQEIAETAAMSGDPDYIKRLQNPMEKYYIKSILEKNKLIVKLINDTEEKFFEKGTK